MNQIVRRILFWVTVGVGGFLAFRLLNLLMVWSLYSWFFQTIRNTSGIPDTLNGAFSIWLVAITLMLLPTFLSVFFWKRDTKKVALVVGAVSAWLVIMYFMSLPQEGRFFNPMTGQAMYRYSQTPNGKIDLFPLGYKFHPRYGNKLELVTPEMVKEMDRKVEEEKAERERQRQVEETAAAQEREREKQATETALKLAQKEQELVQERARAREGEEREARVKLQFAQKEKELAQQRTEAEEREERNAQKREQLDPIIHVNRSIKPKFTYPGYMGRIMYPDLETTGPKEFDVRKLGQWFHPDQINGSVDGWTISKYLKNNDMLTDCLNLQDLEAIQKKGLAFFQQYFGSKHVFGWKSIAGDGSIPFLFRGDVIVELGYFGPAYRWGANTPVFRFVK